MLTSFSLKFVSVLPTILYCPPLLEMALPSSLQHQTPQTLPCLLLLLEMTLFLQSASPDPTDPVQSPPPPRDDTSLQSTAPDPTEVQKGEEKTVKLFLEATCGCRLHSGRPCSEQFSNDALLKIRMDMALLGASSNNADGVVVTSKHKAAERKKAYSSFHYHGQPICTKMFRFLHAVCELMHQ